MWTGEARSAHRGRRLAAVVCSLVAAGCAAGAVAPAQGTVPDLTGSWRNKADPSSAPPWSLKASSDRHTLDATWRGSATNGHPDLRGSFHTTLMQAGGRSFYKGPYQVSEDAPPVGGTITVTIDSANQIEFSLESSNGGAPQKYVFRRVSPRAAPPAKIDTAPAPAAFGATVSEGEPAPGDEAAAMSPPLGDATSADATLTGVSPDDVAFYAAAVVSLARQYCFVQAIKRVTSVFKNNPFFVISSVKAEAGPVYDLLKESGESILLNAAACMADASTISTVLDQINSGSSARAHAAASCGVTSITNTLRSSHGKTRVRKVRIARRKGLSVRCRRSGTTVVLHVTSTSGEPLRKLVGSRLIVGIARSRRDTPGGTLGFTFKK